MKSKLPKVHPKVESTAKWFGRQAVEAVIALAVTVLIIIVLRMVGISMPGV
jgi:hypothetical protein